MGIRGTKPVPTMLANLHGRPNKGRKPNPAEPKPAGDLSAAPDWFTATQKENWDYALANSPPGLLKRLDRGVLTAWVVAEDLHRQAAIAQQKIGLVMRTPNKAVFIQSPYLPIINRQALIMIRAAGELGFTPVSRPRIQAFGLAPGEGLHGGTAHQSGSLEAFLDTDPDTATIN